MERKQPSPIPLDLLKSKHEKWREFKREGLTHPAAILLKLRTTEELAEKPLLATAREGEEIIRQFVEQGMTDARVDAIAVIAPQYFDHGLKGTLKMLARLAGKKVLFIELDEICKLIAMNENVQVI